MRLFLIRHGQTAWNQQNLAIGQSDVPLSEMGERQILALGKRFADIKLDQINCSDLVRCRLTAQAIADSTGAPLTVHKELRERSFGDWESQDYASVTQRLLELSKAQKLPFSKVRSPNGESHEDIWIRVAPFLEQFFTSEGEIALVSHGGTSRVILAYLLRGTLDTTFGFKFDNAGVTQVERRPDGAFLLSIYNDTSHLVGL